MLENGDNRTWHGGCLSRSPMRRRLARGFTLVELLIVVAMVGVLAALAMVGYNKYLTSAHTGEAKAIMQSIRNAEHQWKVDTLEYRSCSASLKDYYPQGAGGPNDRKYSWINDGHPARACFQALNVDSDGPVRFGYAVVAGPGTVAPPAVDGAQFPTSPPIWPQPDGPWYIVQATGDRDVDGTVAALVSSSFDNKIYVENEDE